MKLVNDKYNWIVPEEKERAEDIKKILNNFESLRKEYLKDLKVSIENENIRSLNNEITFNCGRVFVLDLIENEWAYCTMQDMILSMELLKDKEKLNSIVETLYDSENSSLGIIKEFRDLINKEE